MHNVDNWIMPGQLRYSELLRTQIVDSVTFLHQDVSLGSKAEKTEKKGALTRTHVYRQATLLSIMCLPACKVTES